MYQYNPLCTAPKSPKGDLKKFEHCANNLHLHSAKVPFRGFRGGYSENVN